MYRQKEIQNKRADKRKEKGKASDEGPIKRSNTENLMRVCVTTLNNQQSNSKNNKKQQFNKSQPRLNSSPLKWRQKDKQKGKQIIVANPLKAVYTKIHRSTDKLPTNLAYKYSHINHHINNNIIANKDDIGSIQHRNSLNRLHTLGNQPGGNGEAIEKILERKMMELRDKPIGTVKQKEKQESYNTNRQQHEKNNKLPSETLLPAKHLKTDTNLHLHTLKKSSMNQQQPLTHKAQLLQKIPDHRRIRSTTKISQKLIQINQFFKEPHSSASRIADTICSYNMSENNSIMKTREGDRLGKSGELDMDSLARRSFNIRINSQIGQRIHTVHDDESPINMYKKSSITNQQQLQNDLKLKQPCQSGLRNHKHRTQIQQQKRNQQSPLQQVNELISYRQTSPTGDSPSRVHHRSLGFSIGNTQSRFFDNGQSIHRKSKLQDLLKAPQLNTSKQIIHQTQQMRLQSHLQAHPKQWQFHNCLSLQKIELYSTNLKISCEGWTALDHLELKYLRGWNPKMEDDYSPMVRLFVVMIGIRLGMVYGLRGGFEGNMDNIFVRVNDKYIYDTEREKIMEKGEKVRGIPPHTILSLRKLFTAMLITTYNDLVIHSILSLGYILHHLHTSTCTDPLLSYKKQSQYHIFLSETKQATLQTYCQHFQQQCRRICQQLELPATRVVVGFNALYKEFSFKKIYGNREREKERYDFIVVSTALDISVMFMRLLGESVFREMISSRIYEAQLRVQVGWNFWETRVLTWTNEEYVKYRLKAVGGRNRKNNQCFVVWDQQRELIISMSDCKVNMHWKDVERIQHWVEKHIKRFSKKYYLQMSFYPTDTQKFHKIN